MGLRYAFAPRGPALADPGDACAGSAALATAATALRRMRAVRFTCDPEWAVGTPETAAALSKGGLRELDFDVQHRSTWLVPLDGDAAAVLRRLPAGARRNVRLAERAGVVVGSHEDADAVEDLYPLYARTVERQHYVGRPLAYLQALTQALGATVFLASLGDAIVAGAIVVACGRRCCYLFGATDTTAAPARPAYALHLAVMRWGIARGCTVYDMWGVPRRYDPADPAHGYATFKTRWGGRMASHTGLLEVPLWGGADAGLRRVERLVLRRRPLLT